MQVDEIVGRDDSQELSTEEMSHVVEQYILEKRGQKVDINLLKGLPNPQHPLFQIGYGQQVQLLHEAYNYAKMYYLNK